MTSFKDPPIVAFRASSQAASGYNDILLAQVNTQISQTSLLFMKIDDSYCGPQVSRRFDKTIIATKLAFIGSGTDAVMLGYDSKSDYKQYVVVLRDMDVSDKASHEIYLLNKDDLSYFPKVSVFDDMFQLASKDRAIYTHGQRSLQYINCETTPPQIRLQIMKQGFAIKSIVESGDGTILSAASKKASKVKYNVFITRSTAQLADATLAYQVKLETSREITGDPYVKLGLWRQDQTEHTFHAVVMDRKTTQLNRSTLFFFTVTMRDVGGAWQVAEKQIEDFGSWQMPLALQSTSATTAVLVTISKSRSISLWTYDTVLKTFSQREATSQPDFNFQIANQAIGAKLAFKSGSLAEVFIVGSKAQPGDKKPYYASFVMNALGDSIPRQTTFLAAPKTGAATTKIYKRIKLVSQPYPTTLESGLASDSGIDLAWNPILYKQEPLLNWSSCSGCTADASFVAWNSSPQYVGKRPRPQWLPISVNTNLQLPLQSCRKGCFKDYENDFPIQVSGLLTWSNTTTSTFAPTHVLYSESDKKLFTLETFNEQYIGLTAKLSLTVMDSKGFTSRLPNLAQIGVVQDADLFKTALLNSKNWAEKIALIQQTFKVNNLSQSLLAAQDGACGQSGPQFETVSMGKVKINEEKTFGEIATTSGTSLSNQGLLELFFSREVYFPKQTLVAFQKNYEPSVPKFQFEMTEISVERIPIPTDENQVSEECLAAELESKTEDSAEDKTDEQAKEEKGSGRKGKKEKGKKDQTGGGPLADQEDNESREILESKDIGSKVGGSSSILPEKDGERTLEQVQGQESLESLIKEFTHNHKVERSDEVFTGLGETLSKLYWSSLATPLEKLIEVQVMPVDPSELSTMKEHERAEYFASRNLTWTIKSASKTSLRLQVDFKEPRLLGELFEEKLLIKLKFQVFDPKFPQFIDVQIPQQKYVVTQQRSRSKQVAAQSTAAVAGGVGVVSSVLMGGAMQQVWGLLNGLQVIVHMPLLGVVLPGESKDLLGIFTEIANLDLIPNLDSIYDDTFVMPEEDEEDPELESYAQSGYESHYFVNNAGSLLLFILLQLFLVLMVAFCRPCPAMCNCCKRPYLRFKHWVLFNPILRLLLEATLDFSFSIFIQRVTLDKEDLLSEGSDQDSLAGIKFTNFNEVMLWAFWATLGLLPIGIVIFLCCNWKRIEEKAFKQRYGALYDGLRLQKSSVIFYTPVYLIRRILFAIVVCYMNGYIWVQLAFQFLSVLIFSSYLVAFKPLLSWKALGLELMNELTEALLLYHLMVFSDWYPNEELKQDVLAYSFNAVIFANIAVHLCFLVFTMFVQARNKIRRSQCCCCCKKTRKNRISEEQLAAHARAQNSAQKIILKKPELLDNGADGLIILGQDQQETHLRQNKLKKQRRPRMECVAENARKLQMDSIKEESNLEDDGDSLASSSGHIFGLQGPRHGEESVIVGMADSMRVVSSGGAGLSTPTDSFRLIPVPKFQSNLSIVDALAESQRRQEAAIIGAREGARYQDKVLSPDDAFELQTTSIQEEVGSRQAQEIAFEVARTKAEDATLEDEIQEVLKEDGAHIDSLSMEAVSDHNRRAVQVSLVDERINVRKAKIEVAGERDPIEEAVEQILVDLKTPEVLSANRSTDQQSQEFDLV